MIPNKFIRKAFENEFKLLQPNLCFFEFVNHLDEDTYHLFVSIKTKQGVIHEETCTPQLQHIIYLTNAFLKEKIKVSTTIGNSYYYFIKEQEKIVNNWYTLIENKDEDEVN